MTGKNWIQKWSYKLGVTTMVGTVFLVFIGWYSFALMWATGFTTLNVVGVAKQLGDRTE